MLYILSRPRNKANELLNRGVLVIIPSAIGSNKFLILSFSFWGIYFKTMGSINYAMDDVNYACYDICLSQYEHGEQNKIIILIVKAQCIYLI